MGGYSYPPAVHRLPYAYEFAGLFGVALLCRFSGERIIARFSLN
jgi:hypothetical protein